MIELDTEQIQLVINTFRELGNAFCQLGENIVAVIKEYEYILELNRRKRKEKYTRRYNRREEGKA